MAVNLTWSDRPHNRQSHRQHPHLCPPNPPLPSPTALPAWSQTALDNAALADHLKAQAQWNGEVYQLLIDLSGFSLSEYSEQVNNLDQIAAFAQRALLLAQKAQPLTESLDTD